jgi:hypothetical protein
MITFFTIPKPFVGRFDVIQRNAIGSWTALRPRPEVLVFGDEIGTSEACRELGVTHVPGIRVSNFGTPLLSDAFARAQGTSSRQFLCYSNSDIILLSDFTRAASWGHALGARFLTVGRRWDLAVEGSIDFKSDWEAGLRAHLEATGRLHAAWGVDLFLFPRRMVPSGTFPDFAVGRIGWDNWFIRWARSNRIPVVDVTSVSWIIHQDHDYSHYDGGREASRTGPEARLNRKLAGNLSTHFDVDAATHVVNANGLRRNWLGTLYISVLKNLVKWMWLDCFLVPVVNWSRPLRHSLGLRKRK